MNRAQSVYTALALAMITLGKVPRYASNETLNDAIDKVYALLSNNLPVLAEIAEEMEEQE